MVFVCGARGELLCFFVVFFPSPYLPQTVLVRCTAREGMGWADGSGIFTLGGRPTTQERGGGGLGFLKEGGNAVSVSEERPDLLGCR